MVKTSNANGIAFADERKTDRERKSRSARVVFFKYLLIFAFSVALCAAKSNGISPFAPGFAIALSLLGCGLYALLSLPLAALLTGGFNPAIESVCITLVLYATETAFRKRKRETPVWTAFVAGGVGRAAALFFAIKSEDPIVFFIIETALALIFAYAAFCALRPFLGKSVRLRPLVTELACGGIFISALACGLSAAEIWGIKPLYAAAIFAVALACSAGGKGAAIAVAACFGVGSALHNYAVTDIAFLTFVSLVFVSFSDAPRAISVAAAIISVVAYELYFAVEYLGLWKDCIALAVGGAAYCVLPKKAFDALKGRFVSRDKRAVRSLINGGRVGAAEQMRRAQAVFEEMSRALRRSVEPIGYGTEEILSRLKGVCGDCTGCDGAALGELLSATLQKGRAEVSDLGELIRCSCPKAAQLISVASEEVQRAARVTDREDGRVRLREELAAQLDCVCSVLSERARLTAAPCVTDESKEAALIDELSYHGVPAVEVMVTKGEVERVTVVTAAAPTDGGARIAAVAERVLCSRYAVDSVLTTGVDTNTLITLREKTAYDVIFAAASRSKSSAATGDTHSFIKISDTRFMMALCDGMGSGARAGRISETAIDLVESFFKAGFDGEFVLKSVNNFLSGIDEEGFAAFDVLVCDLNTLERTVIKMGSPVSFVKTDSGVGKIEGSALPLGALSSLSPSVFGGTAQENETVVFLSDGITDTLSEEQIVGIIAAHSSPSVRALCDALVDAAREKSGEIRDDMTAIAARIMRRV